MTTQHSACPSPEPYSGHTTYLGHPVEPLKRGLPKHIQSLCPECSKVITARMFEKDGKVWMEKTCPDHGYVKDLYWSDVEMYLKAEEIFYGDGKGIMNPQVTDGADCPSSCGLCQMHSSNTALGNIDLTNRCDLKCPICFANANVRGYVYEPSYEEVVAMLRAYREMKPVAGRAVQLSGGEPTMHPRFLDILKATRELNFSHVQIASNGLKLTDPGFAQACSEAGLHTVYLQFDGTRDSDYIHTRGRALFEKKMQAIDSIRKSGMKIVFVPTIVNTINDDQVGEIIKVALENIDVVSGISFQPVALTGRIPKEERERYRFTLPDLARCVNEQTGITTKDDWFPLSCVAPFLKLVSALKGNETVGLTCHPHCALGTYLFVDQNRKATPITRFIDVKGMFDDIDKIARMAAKTRIKAYPKVKAFSSLHRHFDSSMAPKDLSFSRFLATLEGFMDKRSGRGKGDGTYTYKTLMVAGMHFMDSYNYDTARASRCVIHYSTPGGVYPFCTYNSGPTYRDKVERRFASK